MAGTRRIIHIDMDCFYAAVEMREYPQLRDQPLAVGGASGRGVLTTCNYPARRYGLRSAMPVFKAKQLCPQLVILPVRFDLYRAVSRDIRQVFQQYTDLIEPLSLDEAYLDVTHLRERGSEIAQSIRRTIHQTTGLTASAGIGPNKLIAKIASDWNKPNGQCVVSPSKVDDFMQDLPVRRIWGVGPKSHQKLESMGITTCGALQQLDQAHLVQLFGSFGMELYRLCRGIDERPVNPNRIRKTLSNEHTFSENLKTYEACEAALARQHLDLLDDLKASAMDRKIEKIFIKLKFSDFKRTTAETAAKQAERSLYLELLKAAWGRSGQPVRLLGLGVRFADTHGGPEQLELGLP